MYLSCINIHLSSYIRTSMDYFHWRKQQGGKQINKKKCISKNKLYSDDDAYWNMNMNYHPITQSYVHI